MDKLCTKCKQPKDRDKDFYNDSSRGDGKSPWCKICKEGANAKYKASAKEHLAEKQKQRVKADRLVNPLKYQRRNRQQHLKTLEGHYEEGYLYILQCEDTYKVGRSLCPVEKGKKSRLSILQVGNPFELKIVAQYKTDKVRYWEKYFQCEFVDKRIRGEWFRLTNEDLQMVHGLMVLTVA